MIGMKSKEFSNYDLSAKTTDALNLLRRTTKILKENGQHTMVWLYSVSTLKRKKETPHAT